MPGHAAGDGVDRELDVDAALGQLIVELVHAVLRLRNGHPVTRNDDDAIGMGQHVGDILRRRALDGLGLAGRSRRLYLAERAEQHIGERSVHCPAHDHGQDETRRSVERARDDQQLVLEHESHGDRREPRVGVQQRDDGGHVGAADGNDQQHAKGQRERHERDIRGPEARIEKREIDARDDCHREEQ